MDSVALLGGTVVGVAAGMCHHDQTVVISGGRIGAAGPAGGVVIPPGTDRRDLRGRWVVPGLVDMHCHLTPLSDDVPRGLCLAKGVTTVRDPGGSIAVGEAADIAVWAADPLTATLRPSDLELVIVGGRCHIPAALLHGPASGA